MRRLFVVTGLILFWANVILADVIGVSVAEQVQTGVSVNKGAGLIVTDNDLLVSTTFPPISIGVMSSSGPSINDGTATANITISSYSGPQTAGASTPGLSLVGSTQIGLLGAGGWLPSGATLLYDFTLDQSQPFTFLGTGSLLFYTPGGGPSYAPGSSGVLPPGNYSFAAGHLNSTFNLTITPEPAILSASLLIGGLLFARARTRQQ